jgi:hypothetical protein
MMKNFTSCSSFLDFDYRPKARIRAYIKSSFCLFPFTQSIYLCQKTACFLLLTMTRHKCENNFEYFASILDFELFS